MAETNDHFRYQILQPNQTTVFIDITKSGFVKIVWF